MKFGLSIIEPDLAEGQPLFCLLTGKEGVYDFEGELNDSLHGCQEFRSDRRRGENGNLRVSEVAGDSDGHADEAAPENVAHQGDDLHNSVHGFERGDEDLEIERLVDHVHLATWR